MYLNIVKHRDYIVILKIIELQEDNEIKNNPLLNRFYAVFIYVIY